MGLMAAVIFGILTCLTTRSLELVRVAEASDWLYVVSIGVPVVDGFDVIIDCLHFILFC